MIINVVEGSGLTPGQLSRWAELQEAQPALASPFLRPEFTVGVAAVRDDVHVGVIEGTGGQAGFFPFQRTRLGFGLPVGGARSNLQAAVVDPAVPWDAETLVRGSGLRGYEFHHLLASQTQFRGYETARAGSSVIDLSTGYEGYLAERAEIGSNVLPRTDQQARRLERAHGELTFEAASHDPALLSRLLRWKSEQYVRTGRPDPFAAAWNRLLLERLHSADEPGFGGMLSVLRAGDRVAALAFGLRSQSVWHYWFPAYDRDLATFSPGMILLARMIEEAPRRGLRQIDLGKDDADYKSRLRTGTIDVAEGRIVVSPSVAAVVRFGEGCLDATRRTPLAEPLRRARRELRLRIGGGARV